jgi:hypothetical protein
LTPLLVEKHPKKPKLWRVSEKAEELMNGRLTAAHETMLERPAPVGC